MWNPGGARKRDSNTEGRCADPQQSEHCWLFQGPFGHQWSYNYFILDGSDRGRWFKQSWKQNRCWLESKRFYLHLVIHRWMCKLLSYDACKCSYTVSTNVFPCLSPLCPSGLEHLLRWRHSEVPCTHIMTLCVEECLGCLCKALLPHITRHNLISGNFMFLWFFFSWITINMKLCITLCENTSYEEELNIWVNPDSAFCSSSQAGQVNIVLCPISLFTN